MIYEVGHIFTFCELDFLRACYDAFEADELYFIVTNLICLWDLKNS